MEFRYGFKAEANRIALRVRHKMGLRPIDPIDPAAVCARYDILLLPLSVVAPSSPFLTTLSSEFSAVTVPRGLVTAIVHNDGHHPHRQRSNIAHELGHCFLGHKGTPPLNAEGERMRDGGIEAEANFLGGALLVPNEAAHHILRSGLIVEAQDIYGVSAAMLEYRLRMSGARVVRARSGRAGHPSFGT